MLILIYTLTCGFYILLSFIVALNSQKVNIKANKWLALFLLSLGSVLLHDPFVELKIYTRYPHLIGYSSLFVFLIAPTLYLSILYFVKPTRIFQKKDYWHFFPTALLLVLDIPLYLEDKEEKLARLEVTPEIDERIETIFLLIIPISVYWFLAYRKLTSHQRNVQLFASSIEAIDLSWLRNFLFGLIPLVLLLLNEVLILFPAIIQISSILYAFSAFYLTYFIVKQVEIFPEKTLEVLNIQAIIEENEQRIERKQLLKDQQLIEMKQHLKYVMENDKPYLESTLTLPKLANMMSLSTHELSYLINVGFEDSFFGLVNQFRVEESKRILESSHYKHLSMVGIAFEAGFNSKTAFNTAFKKIEGISPTEFQKLKSL
jgi:AraC-like DNA-binding protein